jgi:hypothetical protein
MDSNALLMILAGAAVVGGLFYVLNRPSKPGPAEIETKTNPHANALQLQAYERLILLVDRIAIPNLISRTSHEGLSAQEMQFVLTKTIRDEFDYNITQQIYIAPEAWNAVKGLKEKNLLIINQVAASLAPNASGLDLNRAILQLLTTDKSANLPALVSEALSFEAKKLF